MPSVHEDCCRILRATLDYFKEKNVSFLKKTSHQGYLRHLLVRRGMRTGEILADLVTTTQTADSWAEKETEEELLEGWKQILLALPLSGSFAGILHTKNDSLADAFSMMVRTCCMDRTIFMRSFWD